MFFVWKPNMGRLESMAAPMFSGVFALLMRLAD